MLTVVCDKHNESFDFLCVEPNCTFRRPCCLRCKQCHHRGHECVQILRMDDLINRFKENPNSSSEISYLDALIKKMYSAIAGYKQSEKELSKMMAAFNNKLCTILKPVSAIDLLLQGRLGSQCRSFIASPDELEPIAQIIRLIRNPQIGNHEQLGRIIQSITSKISQIIQQWMAKMENSFTRLIHEVQQIGITNWFSFFKHQANLQELSKSRYEALRVHQDDSSKTRIPSTTSIIPEQGMGNAYLVKNERQLDQEMVSMLPFTMPPNMLSKQDINVTQQTILSEDAQCTRFVIDQRNKPTTIKQIIDKIKELRADKNYKNSLTELIVESPNEFDINCLKCVIHYFPNLKKLNYLFNFQEDGLKLQKQQVFFEQKKKPKFYQGGLPLCQKSFDQFAQLSKLQNLTIYQPQRFRKKEYKIQNSSLKHITIGRYVSREKVKLASSLKEFLLSYSNLISLNLFNIKAMDGRLLEKLIAKNSRSLRNFWLSECQEMRGNFFQAIAHSKIQSIIFDQNKSINYQLVIPESLKTLILENCEFLVKCPLVNLPRAYNLQNFSIFQSTFPSASNVGLLLLQQISSIPQCKLIYLNLGDCPTANNQGLGYIAKMPNLRQLCLDYTEVCLVELAKHSWIKYLQKLAIVGLKLQAVQTQTNNRKEPPKQTMTYRGIIEFLLKKCEKLRTLSLKFEPDLCQIMKKLFHRLQHIALEIKDTNENQQSLNKFKSSMKEMKISISSRKSRSQSSVSDLSSSQGSDSSSKDSESGRE